MPKNQYCRDYLMHKSGKGLFGSLYDFGVGLADKSAEKKQKQQEWEAQRAASYKMDQQKIQAKGAAERAQQAAAARSTRDANLGLNKPHSAMMGDPRFKTDGKFDKDKYNKWYYALDPSKWRKGGEYYERARQKVKSGIRKLSKIGENLYDSTHANRNIKGNKIATADPFQFYKGNSGPKVSVNTTQNMSKAKTAKGTDWGPKDIAERQEIFKRRQDSKFRSTGQSGPTRYGHW